MEKEKLGRILKKSLIGTLIVGSLGTLAITSLVNLDNYLTTKTNFNKIVNTEKKIEFAQNIKENYQHQDRTYRIFHFKEYNFIKRKLK